MYHLVTFAQLIIRKGSYVGSFPFFSYFCYPHWKEVSIKNSGSFVLHVLSSFVFFSGVSHDVACENNASSRCI